MFQEQASPYVNGYGHIQLSNSPSIRNPLHGGQLPPYSLPPLTGGQRVAGIFPSPQVSAQCYFNPPQSVMAANV